MADLKQVCMMTICMLIITFGLHLFLNLWSKHLSVFPFQANDWAFYIINCRSLSLRLFLFRFSCIALLQLQKIMLF